MEKIENLVKIFAFMGLLQTRGDSCLFVKKLTVIWDFNRKNETKEVSTPFGVSLKKIIVASRICNKKSEAAF